ncbi:HTH-type transcriptional regulator KipR [compost metagenome]
MDLYLEASQAMTDNKDRGDAERGAASASQTLDRAIHLVRLISAARGTGLALSDLVRLAGLTKPTTRRLLVSLIDNGMVEQDLESRRYHLGPETYAFGVIAAERFGIHRLAADSLVRLAALSGDAALLSVQHGTEWVCLSREEGSFPLRSHVLQPGDRHPVGAGAAGLALMAGLSDEEIAGMLAVNADRLVADYPGHPLDALRRQIADTQANGYALNSGYVIKGSWGIAVAFRDPRSHTHAALTIAGVESRFTGGRVEELAAMLINEKTLLEQRLGGGAHPS